MPRKQKPKEIYTPLEFTSRVEKRMRAGAGLLEAELRESIGYDAAWDETVNEAAVNLLAHLEKQSDGVAATALYRKISDTIGEDKWVSMPGAEKLRFLDSLDSKAGRESFPTLARLWDAQRKMRYLKMILEGSVFIQGTPESLKSVVCTAFEAGVAFAESEAKKKLGNKKGNARKPELNAALAKLFAEAAKDIPGRPTPKSINAKLDQPALRAIYDKFNGGNAIKGPRFINIISAWIGANCADS